MGRDLTSEVAFYLVLGFQSTRPCGARPPIKWLVVKHWLQVSIHAPVWGATKRFFLVVPAGAVFQSTRPCGARPSGAVPPIPPDSAFQSTRPCGARHSASQAQCCQRYWFQSTRPCGARLLLVANLFVMLLFQSTRPCGARRIQAAASSLAGASFNPRARVGRDYWPCHEFAAPRRVSIHAPVWGATPQDDSLRGPAWVSIHAPVWGATCNFMLR